MHTKCPVCRRTFKRGRFDELPFCGFLPLNNNRELELRKCPCSATVSIEIARELPGNYIARGGQVRLLTHASRP